MKTEFDVKKAVDAYRAYTEKIEELISINKELQDRLIQHGSKLSVLEQRLKNLENPAVYISRSSSFYTTP